MNFLEIRTAVENELQHRPTVLAHREDARVVVNRVYKAFLGEKKWPFLLRREPIYSFPDLTIPNASLTLAAGWNGGSGGRTVEVPSLFGNIFPAVDEQQYQQFERFLSGAELTLADMTLRGAGGSSNNWELAPFTIEMVVPMNLVDGVHRLQLDPRARFSALSVNSGDYLLKFPRVLLPATCRSVVALRDDQGRPLRAVMPGEQRGAILEERHSSGTPRWFLEDGGAELRLPPWLHINHPTSAADNPRSPFAYERETWPMRETVSAVFATGGAGTYASGSRVRAFCCWYWAGRFGPPSNIVDITATAPASHVNVTGYPTLPSVSGTNVEFGRRVAIFLADGEGAFFLRAFVNNPASTTFTFNTDNLNNGTANMPGLRFPRWDELYPGGPYQYLRIWPRPSAIHRFELEYLARPRELIEDTDSPEFDGDHDVIVWLTVAELLASPRYNADPRPALAMADKYARPLIARNFPQDRYDLTRGQITGEGSYRDHFIPPDIDWRG